ncbi:MAG: hypothetical protein IPO67_27680 [Deltaproteobacteria bacterium]|nr:hypothetical protein [Deltaproteobacteria bacterium]
MFFARILRSVESGLRGLDDEPANIPLRMLAVQASIQQGYLTHAAEHLRKGFLSNTASKEDRNNILEVAFKAGLLDLHAELVRENKNLGEPAHVVLAALHKGGKEAAIGSALTFLTSDNVLQLLPVLQEYPPLRGALEGATPIKQLLVVANRRNAERIKTEQEALAKKKIEDEIENKLSELRSKRYSITKKYEKLKEECTRLAIPLDKSSKAHEGTKMETAKNSIGCLSVVGVMGYFCLGWIDRRDHVYIHGIMIFLIVMIVGFSYSALSGSYDSRQQHLRNADEQVQQVEALVAEAREFGRLLQTDREKELLKTEELTDLIQHDGQKLRNILY